MIFRFLSRYLAQNEQLVNKLSESYPIRRAARWVVYFFNKNKAIADETLPKQILKQDSVVDALKKFRDYLQNRLREK